MYGTAAPRPTTIDWASVLLVSLVSATAFVASAVAVSVAPPVTAVHVPLTATVAVAPEASAPVAPFRVVPPTTSRVVEAAAADEPRFFTVTVNDTDEPTAGLAGLEAMARTCRSGPGASVTTTLVGLLNVLLASFCSTTVLAGSTTAPIVYDPAGRVPMAAETVVDCPAASAGTGAVPDASSRRP